jgi:hypothetical protein
LSGALLFASPKPAPIFPVSDSGKGGSPPVHRKEFAMPTNVKRKSTRRKRSRSEKLWIVLSILIAASMVLGSALMFLM